MTWRAGSRAAVAARIATVLPAPTSPVMTPMACWSTHQVIRATASAWVEWRCSIAGVSERPKGIRVKPYSLNLTEVFRRCWVAGQKVLAGAGIPISTVVVRRERRSSWSSLSSAPARLT